MLCPSLATEYSKLCNLSYYFGLSFDLLGFEKIYQIFEYVNYSNVQLLEQMGFSSEQEKFASFETFSISFITLIVLCVNKTKHN